MYPVTVIIPAYNRIGFLPEAVASVFAQQYPHFELIIVDDGSNDGTKEYLDTLDGSITRIEIPHTGVSRARNTGIEAARYDWVAFLDSDDCWLPQKLVAQVEYLERNPLYRICHTDEIWIRNGIRINQGKKHRKKEGWFFLESLNLCLISPSSVMIHKSIFDDVGMFDESFDWVEDYELWLRITSKYPVGYIDRKLVVKRGGHKDQLSSQIKGIEQYRIRALEQFIKQDGLSSDLRREVLRTYRKKCAIYLAGCRKRGRDDEIDRVQKRMETVAGTVATE